MDYLLFDKPLIYVLNVTDTDFLGIDEIEQILILEHIEGLDGIAAVFDRHAEVRWHCSIFIGCIILYLSFKETLIPFILNCQADLFGYSLEWKT